MSDYESSYVGGVLNAIVLLVLLGFLMFPILLIWNVFANGTSNAIANIPVLTPSLNIIHGILGDNTLALAAVFFIMIVFVIVYLFVLPFLREPFQQQQEAMYG